MLFNNRLLKNAIANFEIPAGYNFEQAEKIIKGWQIALKEHNLENTKETRIQSIFLTKFFNVILGYSEMTDNNSGEWHLINEAKTDFDGTKADGALGFFKNDASGNITRAVIELKDANTSLDKKQSARKDYDTPISQAFSYSSKFDRCDWIIVSNFKEIRLYNKERGQGYYEKFDVISLDKPDEFKRFYYCLCKRNLIDKNRKSPLDELVKDTSRTEEEISNSFYKDFKLLRKNVFEHLCNNNPDIDKIVLLEKTQKLLDRLVFIMFCEDSANLLPPRTLLNYCKIAKNLPLHSDTKVYDVIKGLFDSIDKGNNTIDPKINSYNGGLFKEDIELDNLIIKDEIWSEIVKLSDYDFESDLNVNILGHIFEQSISDIEEIKAEIEGAARSKISKRKKDGIFYTPEYITRYIVEQTIGKYLDENPDKLPAIKILDPACGSGAFLNQAHSYLRERYKQVTEEKIAKSTSQNLNIFEHSNIAENDRSILLNNLFGVDLNKESVEITKLALWLKTAKCDEKLQNLDKNIKCGNSLIDDVDIAGDRAFNWRAEFKDITDSGGFDVIIGNPPYGAELDEKSKKYICKNYTTIEYQIDTYIVFIEQALNLLKNGGKCAFIVPSTWLNMHYFSKIRKRIIEETKLEKILLFKYQVFENVTAETCIFICSKAENENNNVDITYLNKIEDNNNMEFKQISQEYWKKNYQNGFNIFYNSEKADVINKIFKSSVKLEDVVDIKNGIKPYETGKGFPKQTKEDLKNRIYDANWEKEPDYKLYIVGGNINKFHITKPVTWIRYGLNLAAPRKEVPFENVKIVIRQTSDKIIAAVDNNGYLNLNNVHNVILKNDSNINIDYLTALLNSKLMDFAYKYLVPETGRVFAEVKAVNLAKLPIPHADPAQQQSLADKAGQMIELNKQLHEEIQKSLNLIQTEYKPNKISKNLEKFYTLGLNVFFDELEKQKVKLSLIQKEELCDWYKQKSDKLNDIKQKITALDNAIDKDVYTLYNLTDEEIKIIEKRAE